MTTPSNVQPPHSEPRKETKKIRNSSSPSKKIEKAGLNSDYATENIIGLRITLFSTIISMVRYGLQSISGVFCELKIVAERAKKKMARHRKSLSSLVFSMSFRETCKLFRV